MQWVQVLLSDSPTLYTIDTMNPRDENAQFSLPQVPTATNQHPMPGIAAPAPHTQTSPQPSALVNEERLVAEAITEAKKLMQLYQGSPYRQSQALQHLKASYISSRYHITIKLAQS